MGIRAFAPLATNDDLLLLHFFIKSFQCKVICIQSLFALCSIGLLKNDMKLIGAVFKELDTLKESAYKFDIVKLKSIYYCLQVNFFLLIIGINYIAFTSTPNIYVYFF